MNRTFAFGSFLLVPERQVLLHSGRALRIGCRALDLLTALVERPGQLLTKRELMARVWPTTTVEECNLKANMAALRRALDRDPAARAYIATVTGRGYRFVESVEAAELSAEHGAAILAASGSARHPPPARDAQGRGDRLFEAVGYQVEVDGRTMYLIEAPSRGGTVMLVPAGRERSALQSGPRRMLFMRVDSREEVQALAGGAPAPT